MCTPKPRSPSLPVMEKIAVVQLVKSAGPWSDPIKMRGLSNVVVMVVLIGRVGGEGEGGEKIRKMRDGMNWGWVGGGGGSSPGRVGCQKPHHPHSYHHGKVPTR